MKKIVPTLAVPKFVGFALTSQWVARILLAGLDAFLNADLGFKGLPVKGHLSDWLERLDKGPLPLGPVKVSSWKDLGILCTGLEVLGDLGDPLKRRTIEDQLRNYVSPQDIENLKASATSKDIRAYEKK